MKKNSVFNGMDIFDVELHRTIIVKCINEHSVIAIYSNQSN